MIKAARSMNCDDAPGTPSSVEAAATPVTTFGVEFATDAGYRIKTAFPETMPEVPKELAQGERWWCVIDEEGLGTIWGPYLTETAAQSLVAELGRGLVHQMRLG